MSSLLFLSNKNTFAFKNKAKSIKTKTILKLNGNEDVGLWKEYKNFLPKEDYNDVLRDITDGKLSKIFIDTNYKQVVTVVNDNTDTNYLDHYHTSNINPAVIPNLIEKASNMGVSVYFENFTPENIAKVQETINYIFTFTSYLVPILLLGSIISSFRNINTLKDVGGKGRGKKSNQNLFGELLMPNNEKDENIKNLNLTLKSWLGTPEVIEECEEVISYIENKERYKEIGAEMPKGILLEGPPGTGKTLLAKAIASETNSTFIATSGSEFVELFVGMGASRVRDLFQDARENKPSIIFIDEIDAVGRQRGSGAGISGVNDEREQTLNQLLYEMDGFNNNDDIIVMAATNRRDVLDQALLRPGRFDRLINVPLPDADSRTKILEYYLKNKKTSPEKPIDVSAISELTDGFSGAQLKNLLNEAAIISARNNYTTIQERYIFDAFDKLIVGLTKRNATTTEATKQRVAIHESGHSILVLKYCEYFEFKKASIQPTYNGAGGYTMYNEKKDEKNGLYTKDFLKKRLVIAMGGKAAESIYYGNDFVSLGAVQDLKQANTLAKRMIGNFGMGEELEVFYNENVNNDGSPFAGRNLSPEKYSEYTKEVMDRESLNLVKEAYTTAKYILEVNWDKVLDFSEMLKTNTTIYDKDFHIGEYM
jgi:cell division protease FtsH